MIDKTLKALAEAATLLNFTVERKESGWFVTCAQAPGLLAFGDGPTDALVKAAKALNDLSIASAIEAAEGRPTKPIFRRAILDQHAAEIARLREALLVHTSYGCPVCGGDCAAANPPVAQCPTRLARAALLACSNSGEG